MSEDQETRLFSATLRIMDAGQYHEEITRVTGIKPTSCHLRGETRIPESRRMKVWNNDLWALDSPLTEEVDLSNHMNWLWESIAPHSEYFRGLVERGIRVDIFCGYRSESSKGRFVITAGALMMAYRLGIPFGVSVIIF